MFNKGRGFKSGVIWKVLSVEIWVDIVLLSMVCCCYLLSLLNFWGIEIVSYFLVSLINGFSIIFKFVCLNM